jgi:2,4-dienoyl-CoA reductase-like NADH-dependent reductase (Old Yellow Enzyme family)/thioredoxin reductase
MSRSRLLDPVAIGSVMVANRVVTTAHGTGFPDWYVEEASGNRYIAYQERRARGGIGLIVAQPLMVPSALPKLAPFTSPADMRSHDFMLDRWRRLVEAVHPHGTKIFAQLGLNGAAFSSDGDADLRPLWSLNGAPSGFGEVSHKMTEDEIEETIDAFVSGATLAQRAGLDGVELHGTHGYLLQQSYSLWGNGRDDRFGEPTALVTAILEGIREKLGREFVVGLRVSTDDFVEPAHGGLGPAGLRAVTRRFVDTGMLDYISHSEGSQVHHYARSVGSYQHPHGEWLSLTAELKREVGDIPLVGAGRLVGVEAAERALADGVCDLVAMTRAHVADPDIVNKVRGGHGARIRPCVGANQGCIDRILMGLPITCLHNPEVGRESTLPPLTPVAQPRAVVVIGGGPAGCKTAEVAARRGHRVTLFERHEELGGTFRLAATLEPARELLKSITWLAAELEALGVDVNLGHDVTAAEVMALNPDAVVVATGVTYPALALPARASTDGSIPLLYPEDVLSENPHSGRYLVVDWLGARATATASEVLATRGNSVTIVAPGPTVSANIGFTALVELPSRLWQVGCTLMPNTDLAAIEQGHAELIHVHSGAVQREPFDFVVLGVRGQPATAVADELRGAGVEVRLAGDVVAPRTALNAFREGEDAARQL